MRTYTPEDLFKEAIRFHDPEAMMDALEHGVNPHLPYEAAALQPRQWMHLLLESTGPIPEDRTLESELKHFKRCFDLLAPSTDLLSTNYTSPPLLSIAIEYGLSEPILEHLIVHQQKEMNQSAKGKKQEFLTGFRAAISESIYRGRTTLAVRLLEAIDFKHWPHSNLRNEYLTSMVKIAYNKGAADLVRHLLECERLQQTVAAPSISLDKGQEKQRQEQRHFWTQLLWECIHLKDEVVYVPVGPAQREIIMELASSRFVDLTSVNKNGASMMDLLQAAEEFEVAQCILSLIEQEELQKILPQEQSQSRRVPSAVASEDDLKSVGSSGSSKDSEESEIADQRRKKRIL